MSGVPASPLRDKVQNKQLTIDTSSPVEQKPKAAAKKLDLFQPSAHPTPAPQKQPIVIDFAYSPMPAHRTRPAPQHAPHQSASHQAPRPAPVARPRVNTPVPKKAPEGFSFQVPDARSPMVPVRAFAHNHPETKDAPDSAMASTPLSDPDLTPCRALGADCSPVDSTLGMMNHAYHREPSQESTPTLLWGQPKVQPRTQAARGAGPVAFHLQGSPESVSKPMGGVHDLAENLGRMRLEGQGGRLPPSPPPAFPDTSMMEGTPSFSRGMYTDDECGGENCTPY